jgi:hypothetical protein
MFECFLAKKMGKKVVKVNKTIDVQDLLNKKMGSFVYKKLDLHITREPLSQRDLVGMGMPESKVIVCADSGFSANFQIGKSIDATKKDSVKVAVYPYAPLQIPMQRNLLNENMPH